MLFTKRIKLIVVIIFSIFVSLNSFQAASNVKKKELTKGSVVEIETPLEVLSQNNEVTAGGFIHAKLSKPTRRDFLVYLGQTKAVMIESKDNWHILAGVDVNTMFGDYLLSVQTKKSQILQIPFTVNSFVNQFINNTPNVNGVIIKPAGKVVKSLLWSNREPVLPLIYPSNGQWSDDFGAYYNSVLNKPNNRLNRVDYLMSEVSPLTEVLSPGKATCFDISYDEKMGYRVLLDHGMGLFSEISGLTNIAIEEQDIIEKGDVISTFGKEDFIEKKQAKKNTIFWRVFMTNASINPKSLTHKSMLNETYEQERIQ